MSQKSWVVHYKNKYPNGRVMASENAIDVFNSEGEHVVAIRKDGAGMWSCVSEEMGLSEKHCLAPIPRDTRVHKIVDGKIGLDPKHAERMKAREKFTENGKVHSIAALKEMGVEFDNAGNFVKGPASKSRD